MNRVMSTSDAIAAPDDEAARWYIGARASSDSAQPVRPMSSIRRRPTRSMMDMPTAHITTETVPMRMEV